ncbi:hypothetical protein NL676_000610 [Syzygium grande]|nr:hypothetical protein NL676_000610 [Syzygium grande]
MKITGKSLIRLNIPASEDSLPEEGRGSTNKWSSRPETPLLKWKTEDKERNILLVDSDEEEDNKSLPQAHRISRQRDALLSSRKLATMLWRLQLIGTNGDGGGGGGTGGGIQTEKGLYASKATGSHGAGIRAIQYPPFFKSHYRPIRFLKHWLVLAHIFLWGDETYILDDKEEDGMVRGTSARPPDGAGELNDW